MGGAHADIYSEILKEEHVSLFALHLLLPLVKKQSKGG
jgi:hypothetical protein